jgi:hypothetical protein
MIESIDETALRALRQAEVARQEAIARAEAAEARVQELEEAFRLTFNELLPYAAALRSVLSKDPNP